MSLSLEQLINKAAEELPDYWRIELVVEKGYGEVVLINPEGKTADMRDGGDMSIAEQLSSAIDWAKDGAENKCDNHRTIFKGEVDGICFYQCPNCKKEWES